MASVPTECRLFATIPLDSTSELLPWAQSRSMAACRQSIALAPISDPEQFRPMIAVRIAGGDSSFGGASYGGTPYADRSRRLHQLLEALLVKERDAALAAFHDIARLAHDDPGAAQANRVMAFVVVDAQRRAALLR